MEKLLTDESRIVLIDGVVYHYGRSLCGWLIEHHSDPAKREFFNDDDEMLWYFDEEDKLVFLDLPPKEQLSPEERFFQYTRRKIAEVLETQLKAYEDYQVGRQIDLIIREGNWRLERELEQRWTEPLF